MHELIRRQRDYYLSHATRELAARREALRRLRAALLAWEPRLCEALQSDLGKQPTESYMSEIGMVLSGIRDLLTHLRRWSRPRSFWGPLAQFPSRCRVEREPYGVTLVVSPWNYPLLLALDPLAASLAAGNTVILKPSEDAPATSAVLAEMLAETFSPELVAVVQGGREVAEQLLQQQVDYIFFTGSPAVGKRVMAAAAAHLTPVTLELGGKSPCIVAADADVALAARRIAFGKVLNAGQTCVAPDYVFVHRSRREEFITAYRRAVEQMVGFDPLHNEALPHIINRRHYERVMRLLEGVTPALGGQGDPESLRIAPALLTGVTPESPCMQEEIFGPLLPLMTFETPEEVEAFVQARPRPLACYLFTRDRGTEQRFMSLLSFGGGCVNDTVIHLAVPELPFGGVGNSGMGAYHGRTGFETFTHAKSILRKGTWLDLPFRYQPYSRFKALVLRLFLR